MADILGDGSSEPSAKRQKRAVAGLGPVLCERLRIETLHLCATTGALLGAAGPFHHAPCSLLPYPFPAPLFKQAIDLAKPFNSLVDRVARDVSWLTETVRTTVEHDPFTRRLLEILETVQAEGITQPLQLSINRSDYMIDQPTPTSTPRILQVELNTVSVSFVSLGAKMTEVHTHAMERLSADLDTASRAELLNARPALSALLSPTAKAKAVGDVLPPNGSASAVAAGMALAHKKYAATAAAKAAGGGGGGGTGNGDGGEGPALAVLMVVQPNERNVVDQRGIEHTLWKEHGVPLVRATLADVKANGSIGADGKLLLVQGGGVGRTLEVSLVYFRAGYTPDDYPGEAEWSARLLIERSLSVKCPSIAQHLAGTKKVQQVLALPKELARFASADEAAQLSACFAKLHGLEEGGGAAVDAIVAEARKRPDSFVLKPQREGGGNNLYGSELADALGTMSAAERASFILMERILPPSAPTPLMRQGELDGGGCTCELGVYGVVLTDGKQELCNEAAGHLLRVKLDGVDEGGVCAGFAVLSSPLLYA